MQKSSLDTPFHEMTNIQKKYRIKRLWIKARLVYHFIRMKQANTKNKVKDKTGKVVDEADDIDLDSMATTQENVWRWYIIRQENSLPQLWNFIINMLTIYALFATPFILVFSEFGEDLRAFEMFVDACFALDIVFNFFKLSDHQKEKDMKLYAWNYVKSLFIIDCLAAIPGLVTAERGDNFFKLLRFVHWNRFFD
mmetsp:Transcript_24655/g.38335  ORF Transcript_24655/g.38335 Transcript_24655/m.38335 type:complete len:195 (+) Transcript_24655:1068-1652(+)